MQDTLEFVQSALDSGLPLEVIVQHLEDLCVKVTRDTFDFINGEYMCPGLLTAYGKVVSSMYCVTGLQCESVHTGCIRPCQSMYSLALHQAS